MVNSNLGDEIQKVLAAAPAYHKVGPEFIRKLKAAVERSECAEGRNLHQKQFGKIVGVPKSTIHDWAEGGLPAPIEAMLCGLERLSEPQRLQLLREFCRDCPRLDHLRLAHNTQALVSLRPVLLQRAGLTIIQGSVESACTFLFTAIGNSIGRFSPQQRVCGIDFHFPVNFSPVPGVYYVRQNTSDQLTQEIVRRVWSRLRRSQHEVLMLNGAISIATELTTEVLSTSSKRHVILAGDSLPFLKERTRSAGRQATLLTASVDRGSQKIDVSISYVTVGS